MAKRLNNVQKHVLRELVEGQMSALAGALETTTNESTKSMYEKKLKQYEDILSIVAPEE